MKNTQRSVIVTGGGSGIGRAVARAFADRGDRVLVVGRTPGTLAETVDGYKEAHALAVDITDRAGLTAVADEVRERWGGAVDVLVNNAATAAFGTLGELTREAVEAQVATNLVAPALLTQAVLGPLETAGGVVVNIGSAGALGLRAWPGNSVYGATKAGLDLFTRSWAVELGPRGIRVVGVAPGVIDTGTGVRAGMSQEAYDGFLEAMGQRTPLGRTGASEEIARWVVQLADPEASFITGTTVAVDGGLSLT
ncbi:SDR family NAD(P)-dependent oxidoreductase [Streptomyces sp. CA-278952]|uniref:SDR family NAD(P)-dependent oxidoreductase n=1 Tax=unclassified Streptomyces TaxID=2593676 RepID=UPI00224193F9|nr:MULTISPECIES: SDR family oxidoreductase [unclassified Streptomyces]UZI28591.1 SDR family oxidoreductase [Streptomyces sp. VB1]WDG28529.1 SDR family NAD(P)-dependent oxidoreductase [Streptomyces sp. CA-278952]